MKLKYVAFLRGINVGGHKKVNMGDLRAMFAAMGFANVKTLLNSGNVIFETGEDTERELVMRIEENVIKTFGFESRIMLRTLSQIETLMSLDPFQEIAVAKDVRLYVTFLPEKSKSQLKLPFTSPDESFQILQRTDREVFSVLTLKTARSVDAMAFIEQEFGKDVTTRNWNTIGRVIRKGHEK